MIQCVGASENTPGGNWRASDVSLGVLKDFTGQHMHWMLWNMGGTPVIRGRFLLRQKCN